jgi:hypothetical protein
MELFILPPFAIGLAIALLLRNHLKVVGVLAGVATVLLVAFGSYDLSGEGEYAGLATLILGALAACWMAGMGVGAAIAAMARRARLS